MCLDLTTSIDLTRCWHVHVFLFFVAVINLRLTSLSASFIKIEYHIDQSGRGFMKLCWYDDDYAVINDGACNITCIKAIYF